VQLLGAASCTGEPVQWSRLPASLCGGSW